MQSLISNLIRPFRFRYSIFDLGAKYTQKYERDDGSMLNDRGFKIQYSYYKNKIASDVCFVYAHCNSGCRVEGLQFIQSVIDQGWNLCLFDFVGSGISEGEYISLGYYESMDLQTIISFLLKEGNSKIHLWGRSMGAATIILYLSQTKQIDAIVSCVLDSPYCSLWKVIKEFGKSKIKIPQFIIEHLMEFIRKNIIKQHQFDIKELQLVRKIHKIDIPIMFIASTNDSFVNFNHATELYKWANSKVKILQYIEKQHNSPRQSNTVAGGLAFMFKSLHQKENNKKQLKILSKKKELCRKMTGHNMAQLITKSPTKKQIKGIGSNSSGNLTRFTSFCSLAPKNKQKISGLQHQSHSVQKDLFQLKVETERYVDQKHRQNLSSTKSPHILQQSIIKLTLPSEIYQNLNHNKQNKLSKHNIEIKNINLAIDPKIQLQTWREINLQKQEKFKQNNNCANPIDKENNFNLNNNCSINFEEETPSSNSKIKNISSIMIKRFNFEQQNYHINQKQKGIERIEKPQCKKSKSQKINMLYVKGRKSVDITSNVNKQSGIKLFTKITTMAQRHHHVSAKQENSESSDEKMKTKRQRIKTQIPHLKEKSSQQSQEQINYKQPNFKQEHKNEKNIGGKSTKIYSSYSDISLQVQEGQQGKWNCGSQQLCSIGTLENQTKKIKCNNVTFQNYKIQQNPKRNVYLGTCGLNNTNVNQNYLMRSMNEKSQKIAMTNQNDYNVQNRMEKMNKQTNNNFNLSKTQKIIKIQLDKNLIQQGNSSTTKKSQIKFTYPYLNTEKTNKIYQPKTINQINHRYEKQFEKNNSCIPDYGFINQNMQINPTYSKVKVKNKKMLKINAIQVSNNSFL